ncbi:MAG TPA: hypothetical protein VNV86_11595 [Candidatus Acidoferrum sp.]|nr:hypothetical protein [Candidatus Acidoferrum sp.]
MGPVSIAQGANGAAQTVEAYNIGDGSLNLSLSSSVTWIGATAGAQRACTTRAGVCTPLTFALNTSGVPVGTATGIVTVSDPNSVDAPQTITVTVQINGSVPGTVDLYAAPGSSNELTFSTNSPLNATTRTTDGGNWLSVALDGVGSFRFSYPYKLRVAPPQSMAAGNYSGVVTTTGSAFAADNKTIGVTMRVTTQPIAATSVDRVRVKLAQGAPAYNTAVALTNSGQAPLTIGTVTSTGGSWLTASSFAGGAALKFTVGDLAPGSYTGSVTIASNAANGAITVPVDFTVVAKGSPLINYQGVVDNGTFVAGDSANAGDVMVVLGDQLSFGDLTVGPAPPLATQIGGAKVLVNGNEAPMYYSSYGQLAFQMPYGTPLGLAEIQVVRDGLFSNKVSVNVAARAPRALLIGVGTYGAIVNQDGSIPMPVGSFPGVNTHPAKAGDTLTIYAIGLGVTSPQPVSGVAAPSSEPFARLTATPTVTFGGGIGGITAQPLYAGLTPTYAGLYQVNVTIPQGTPKGTINLSLVFPDSITNAVQIVVE